MSRAKRKASRPTPAPAEAPRWTPPAISDWKSVAILGLTIAVFFHGILFQKYFFWEDWLTQVYPFRAFAATSLASGEWPLWNPYTYAGMPFQADIQSAVFYLPNLLLTLAVRDSQLAFYWVELLTILHYWLAAVGMYFLAKELGLGSIYAIFSGLVFALSGFMVVHAIHPGFVAQVAWFPVVLLLTHRAASRRSLAYAVGAGLVAGHSMLAGSPQMTLYLFILIPFMAALAVATGDSAQGERRGIVGAGLVLVMIVVAAGVAAIQLLPTIELIPHTQRAALSFEDAQRGRLPLANVLTGIVPKYFGASHAQATEYWASNEHGTYWETHFYMGIPALLALVVGITQIRKHRAVGALIALSAGAFLIALGDQFVVHRFLFDWIPPFSSFRAPARALVLATFAGALLAGVGLRTLAEGRIATRVAHTVLIGVVVAAVGVRLAAAMNVALPSPMHPDFAAIQDATAHEANVAVLLAFAAAGVGVWIMMRPATRTLSLAAFAGLQFVDLMIINGSYNDGLYDPDAYYEKARGRLASLPSLDRDELLRVASRKDNVLLLDRNLGMVDRVQLTEGYTPLALARSVPPARDWDAGLDLLNVKYRVDIDSAASTIGFRRVDSYLPRAWLVHGAVAVASDSALLEYMRSSSFDPRATVVMEREPIRPLRGGPMLGVDSVTITSWELNAISAAVVAGADGMLVFSEIYYPGWKATIDGAPAQVHRVNWSLRGVEVPAGSHRVLLEFRPASLWWGAIISVMTLIACGVILGLHYRSNAIRMAASSPATFAAERVPR